MTSVLVADDQALVRDGLRLLLEAEGFEVAGEAADGRQAVELARRLEPDVALVDVRMPVMDGIEATRRIGQAGLRTRVVVLTTFDLDAHVHAALQAGAAGFLLKDAERRQIAGAVRAAAAGEDVLAPAVLRRVVEHFLRRPPADAVLPAELRALTERELDVLRRMARGLSNGEIAAELVVSEATVKTHVRNVLRKLGARDRVGAVIVAHRAGLADEG